MFKHRLAKKSWISREIARDKTITTVLHVELVEPAATGSSDETAITEALVDYMNENGIDRAHVGPASDS